MLEVSCTVVPLHLQWGKKVFCEAEKVAAGIQIMPEASPHCKL